MAEKDDAFHRYLEELGGAELLDEFESRMDEMTDLTYDETVMEAYLSALEKKVPLEDEIDVDQSWEKFRSEHADLFEGTSADNQVQSKKKRYILWPQRHRLLPRAAVTIILAGVLSVLCAQAAGVDILEAVGKWREDTFHFVLSTQGGFDGAEKGSPSNEDYHRWICSALESCGITTELAPAWYPEGFESSGPKFSETSIKKYVYCSFSGEEKSLILVIEKYNSASDIERNVFEKDDRYIEVYNSNGREFYIMSNMDALTAAWSDGYSLLVSISGNVSEEEMKAMIDSMGE